MAKTKTSGRIDRHKLKEPDEFISWTTRSIAYVRENWKRVAWIAGGAVLAAAVIAAYLSYRANRALEASHEVTRAISEYAKTPTDSAPFDRIAEDYAGTQGARIAHLYQGHVWYQKKDYAKAVEAYGALAADGAATDSLRAEALLGQGYALVEMKRCGEAESVLNQLPNTASLSQQDAFLAVGRCFELQGDTAAALKRYEEFAGRFPQSPYLTDVLRDRIEALKKK